MFTNRSWLRAAAIAAAVAADLTALGTRTAYADFASAVVTTQPIAYYRLDSTDGKSQVGTTTYKTVGGVASASPGAPVGANSSYASLNGSDGYIVTTQAGGVGATASLMVWVNLAALPSQEGHIFYVAGESQNGNDLDLQFENDNALKFYTAAGGHLTYTPAPPTLLNRWHMIVATMDNASQTRVIYWDGQPVANDMGGGRTGKTGIFSVGASTVFGGRFFHGGVEEAALWDRALTAAEVASIYRAAQPAAPQQTVTPGVVSNTPAASGGLFPTTAKVEVGDNNGPVPLKREEQIAIMFLSAIQQIESECLDGAKPACTQAQLMTSGSSHADHLKYDPRTDPNYTYTVRVNGTSWEVHATPKKADLLAFYSMARGFPGIPTVTYSRAADAGVIDTELGNRSIDGDSFATR